MSFPRWRTHAKANWVGVQPCLTAKLASLVYRTLFFSKFSPVNLGFEPCHPTPTSL